MKNENKNALDVLTAQRLRATLWDTLQGVRSGETTPQSAAAVAAQAREILRAVKVQLAIFAQSGKGVSQEVVDFASSND